MEIEKIIMKIKKHFWKYLGATVGVISIAVITPVCVVSCGSSTTIANNTNANQSTSNLTISDLQTTWANQFSTIENSSDYSSWMKNNLEQYCKNAPSYFHELTNEYWTITNQKENKNFTSDYLPIELNETIINQFLNDSKSRETLYFNLEKATLQSFSYSATTGFNLSLNYSYYSGSTSYNDGKLIVQNDNAKTFTITEDISDAKFSPTILAPINELLNNQNSKIATLNGWYLSSCKTNSIDFYGEAEGATSYANPTTISLINAPNAINQLYIFIHPNNANTSTTSNGITNINKTSGWTYGGSAWDSFSLGQIAGYVYNESTLVNANQAVSNPDLSLLSALSKSNLSVTSISIQESSSSTDKTK